MKAWIFCFFFVLSRLSSALGEDTVVEDIDEDQIDRLVELLTTYECVELLFALSNPEENIFEKLERLSEENNTLELKTRVKRDTSPEQGSEAECRKSLTGWLLQLGEQTYYDRLTRGLQHIGRTDIALEVGKNINQDKIVNLKRYVEDYHKYATSLKIPSFHVEEKDRLPLDHKTKIRKERDLAWSDLDLIVEREPVPPYEKGPMRVVLPVLYGILLGFGGTLLVGAFVLLIILRLSSGGERSPPPQDEDRPLKVAEDGRLEDAVSGRSDDI